MASISIFLRPFVLFSISTFRDKSPEIACCERARAAAVGGGSFSLHAESGGELLELRLAHFLQEAGRGHDATGMLVVAELGRFRCGCSQLDLAGCDGVTG